MAKETAAAAAPSAEDGGAAGDHRAWLSIPVGGGGCCGPAVAVRVRLTRAARPAGAPGWAHAAGLPARRVQLFAAAERDAAGAPSGSLGLWASWRLGRGRAAAARLELGEAYELRQTGRILTNKVRAPRGRWRLLRRWLQLRRWCMSLLILVAASSRGARRASPHANASAPKAPPRCLGAGRVPGRGCVGAGEGPQTWAVAARREVCC